MSRRCPTSAPGRHSPEEKIRIVLDGLRGEYSIAELCRREGIAESLYYTWSKEFLEAGKRRLAGDTARAAQADLAICPAGPIAVQSKRLDTLSSFAMRAIASPISGAIETMRMFLE